MKKEIAEKWVTALRSGKYEQGAGRLKTDSGRFCCLGVLCDISGLIDWKKSYKDYGYTDIDSFIGSAATPPRSVLDWAGLQSEQGIVGENDWLTTRNDEGQSFARIADVIETYWERL